MTHASTDSPPISSARPHMTRAVMAQTGLDEDVLHDLVHRFYAKVRKDALLGPIFADRITDWGPHLDRMVDFWSSVALMTGRYHGAPVPKHTSLPITSSHFNRWLAL
ncbi:group III truncated hemoglobin, partial [Marivita sp. S0852]|uniref:group III truncated hemoglobin n=1 Tax=Marivita sp. S0852 TaxID=3373893 RepID=UPI003981EECC